MPYFFEMPENPFTTGEDFEELLKNNFSWDKGLEGNIVTGTVLRKTKDMLYVDVGLKSAGILPIREFLPSEMPEDIVPGSKVDVYVERYESRNGHALISREKARRGEAWRHLSEQFTEGSLVEGTILNRVKGGFTVDVMGAIAFLPGSQVDIQATRNTSHLIGTTQTFKILKMDAERNNVVVSRRALVEEERTKQRDEVLAQLEEGMILEGVVKNLTDYGAFVDLGAMDGLLHITDISWNRIGKPSAVLSIGQKVKVKVIRFNPKTQRVSLGMKQLEEDPWKHIAESFQVGHKMCCEVTNIVDYGIFVRIAEGVEGLVHVSEMSWVRKNLPPSKLVQIGDEVDVCVLEVSAERRRISLSMKQCVSNPWESFQKQFAVGTLVKGEVKNITDFGLFISLTENIDGMIHVSDLSWAEDATELLKNYKKGDVVEAKVLDVNIEKERITLGVKQLTEDSEGHALAAMKKGNKISGVVSEITQDGIKLTLPDNLEGFVKKIHLGAKRAQQDPTLFTEGETVEGLVFSVDKKTKTVFVSIKALTAEEEEKALDKYAPSKLTNSLGDALRSLSSLGGDSEEKKDDNA